MTTLFDIEPTLPQGFVYIPDFLSLPEELELYNEILKIELSKMSFHGYTANRKVKSFGYDYSFETRKLTKGNDIPEAFASLVKKTGEHLSINPVGFAELLVTEYPIGSVINWHRDAPPFDIIVGISLMSDCTFRLRPHDKAKQNRASVISLPVKRRSLYVMQGSSRSDWQHSISPVKEVRYSITLRTLLH